MSKLDKSKQSLPKAGQPATKRDTPPTLAGKKGVAAMGVPTPKETDLTKRPTEKLDETIGNLDKLSINTTNMSKKSLFTKLFEDAMGSTDFSDDAMSSAGVVGSDEEALGIESGDEGDYSDEVTFKLDRATAEKLHAVLGSVLGGELGEDEDFEEDLGEGDEGGEGEDFGEEEGGGGFGESVDTLPTKTKANNGTYKTAPDTKPLNQKIRDGKNNTDIVGSKLKSKDTKASSNGHIHIAPDTKPLNHKIRDGRGSSNKVPFTNGKNLFNVGGAED